MRILYYPIKLMQVKEQIALKHSSKDNIAMNEKTISNIRNIIMEIVSLTTDELEDYAYTLSSKELRVIAIYLPKNSYGIDISNLISLLSYRINITIADLLYSHWQNNYKKIDNARIFEMITKNFKISEYFTQKYKMDANDIRNAIIHENIVQKYCLNASKIKSDSLEEFTESLELLGLNSNFELEKECLFQFHLFCSANAYIILGQEKLYQFVVKIKREMEKKLLLNMLLKLTIYELDGFYNIAKHFYMETGGFGTAKFNAFFDDIDKEIVDKYHTWINRWNINRVFINDDTNERSIFWMKYSSQADITYMRNTETLILKFKQGVFIEFRVMGPVYKFSTDYYENIVQPHVQKAEKDSVLKSWLYNMSDHDFRKVHSGYWQNDVARQICKLEH